MKPQPGKRKRKFHIGKGLRLQIYAWCTLVGVVMLVGMTYAWYSQQESEGGTENVSVMKPYYLELKDDSDSDVEQISVENISGGETKQIVFCVKDRNAEKRTTPYKIELIYTSNFQLTYVLYRLEKVDAGQGTVIVSQELLTFGGDTISENTSWSKVDSTPMSGDETNSEAVHTALGVNRDDIVNKGTYRTYSGLELPAVESGYSAQFFVLEVTAPTAIGNYNKETDMIYLTVKAEQPEPNKSTNSTESTEQTSDS